MARSVGHATRAVRERARGGRRTTRSFPVGVPILVCVATRVVCSTCRPCPEVSCLLENGVGWGPRGHKYVINSSRVRRRGRPYPGVSCLLGSRSRLGAGKVICRRGGFYGVHAVKLSILSVSTADEFPSISHSLFFFHSLLSASCSTLAALPGPSSPSSDQSFTPPLARRHQAHRSHLSWR